MKRFVLIATVLAAPAAGQVASDAQAKLIADLQRRVEAQQAQLAQQADELRRLATQVAATSAMQGASAHPVAAASAALPVTPVPTGTLSSPGRDLLPATLQNGPGAVLLDRPGFKATISGAIRVNAYLSQKRTLGGAAAPFFLAPPDASNHENIFALTAQYSRIGLSLEGPVISGFQTGAEFLFQLYNGQVFGGQYGLNPAIAFAYASDGRWTFSVGRRMELFSDRYPDMLDTVSALAASGNPGNGVRSQLRVDLKQPIGDHGALVAGLAASDPISTSISSNFNNRTENNGIPNIEGKLAYTLGPPDAATLLKRPAFEVGVSTVYGEYRQFSGIGAFRLDVVKVKGLAIDGGVRLGDRFGIQGEYYWGRALGNYLGSVF